jgi:tetratricopeptide (TPR) repeat protein
MSIVCGKVMEARAKKASGQEAQEAIEKALSYYERAVEALKQGGNKPRLVEAYCLLARLLEASGQQDQAITIWKSAYMTSAGDHPDYG